MQTWLLEHRTRLWNTSPTVLLPWDSLMALISWHDNHTTVSLCCQPISEPRSVSCLAQKTQSSGYFLIVLDWIVLLKIRKIRSLLQHNFQKSIYKSFITRPWLHILPVKSVGSIISPVLLVILSLHSYCHCNVYNPELSRCYHCQ